MNQIAIDMHLIREIAPVLKRTFNLNTDLEGTVDAWGSGFVDELDYIAEARSAEDFTESIASTPLSGVVYAPRSSRSARRGRSLRRSGSSERGSTRAQRTTSRSFAASP